MKSVKKKEGREASPSLPFQIAVILSLVVVSWGIGFFFHSILKTDIIYTHFIYIPVVIATMWWGKRGILVAISLGIMITSFHLFGIATCPVWHDLIRMLFFVMVAFCIGFLRQEVLEQRKELSLSEKKYKLLIEDSLTGVLVYREDRIVFANRRIEDILHHSKEELTSRSIWELIHSEDIERIKRMIAAESRQQNTNLSYQCRFVRKDEMVVWADVSRSETIYEGETAVLMNIYDITKRKELEEKRKELSSLAKKQEEQLIHYYRLIELGEMAAAISHELNQPLTGIQNYAKNAIYMMDHNLEGPDKVRSNLSLISNQVNRASKIIHQMRELARRSEMNITTIDINDLIMECVEFLLPQLRLSGVQVHLILDEDPPPVLGDWVRLEQVFLNLLSNARQAMDDVESKHVYIRTGADDVDDSGIFVEVRDTGKGFSKAESEKLFKPFYTTKQPGEGMGLGLSISLRIIREHGGTIETVSTPGQGSTFKVRLPEKTREE
ncbi:MAG TPA: ATP-binding protein [Spirochaetota bacterium]|nr:ATP-binding protein [Spirochaetota bacterium]